MQAGFSVPSGVVTVAAFTAVVSALSWHAGRSWGELTPAGKVPTHALGLSGPPASALMTTMAMNMTGMSTTAHAARCGRCGRSPKRGTRRSAAIGSPTLSRAKIPNMDARWGSAALSLPSMLPSARSWRAVRLMRLLAPSVPGRWLTRNHRLPSPSGCKQPRRAWRLVLGVTPEHQRGDVVPGRLATDQRPHHGGTGTVVTDRRAPAAATPGTRFIPVRLPGVARTNGIARTCFGVNRPHLGSCAEVCTERQQERHQAHGARSNRSPPGPAARRARIRRPHPVVDRPDRPGGLGPRFRHPGGRGRREKPLVPLVATTEHPQAPQGGGHDGINDVAARPGLTGGAAPSNLARQDRQELGLAWLTWASAEAGSVSRARSPRDTMPAICP